MNSASNMIAKWYQNAASPPPNASLKIWEMPKASVGAPPVRETSSSSTEADAACSWSGLSVKPRVPTNSAAPSTVPPVIAAGALMAK